MGAGWSGDDPTVAREQIQQQQQRAQLLLLSQLRDQRAGLAVGSSEDGHEFGLRPVEQPDLRQTEVFRNPLHVQGRTLRIKRIADPDAEGKSRWELSFTFDTLTPSEVVVYIGDWEDAMTRPPTGMSWESETQSFPQPGLGQRYRGVVNLVLLLKAQESFAGWGTVSEPRIKFCVEVREAADQAGLAAVSVEAKPAEWTKGLLVLQESACGAKNVAVQAISQSVQLSGVSLPLMEKEVFGAESRDPAVLGQDCVICMSALRDTTVLPCRHMCLCGTCAEAMRSRVQYRSYRCPICRERVSSLLQICEIEQEGSNLDAGDPLFEVAPPAAVVPPL